MTAPLPPDVLATARKVTLSTGGCPCLYGSSAAPGNDDDEYVCPVHEAIARALLAEHERTIEMAVEWFSTKVDGLSVLDKLVWREAMAANRFPAP